MPLLGEVERVRIEATRRAVGIVEPQLSPLLLLVEEQLAVPVGLRQEGVPVGAQHIDAGEHLQALLVLGRLRVLPGDDPRRGGLHSPRPGGDDVILWLAVGLVEDQYPELIGPQAEPLHVLCPERGPASHLRIEGPRPHLRTVEAIAHRLVDQVHLGLRPCGHPGVEVPGVGLRDHHAGVVIRAVGHGGRRRPWGVHIVVLQMPDHRLPVFRRDAIHALRVGVIPPAHQERGLVGEAQRVDVDP